MIPLADHVCAVCESDCDEVTRLRMLVRDLSMEVLRLGFMLATFEEAIELPAGVSGSWFAGARR